MANETLHEKPERKPLIPCPGEKCLQLTGVKAARAALGALQREANESAGARFER